MRKLISYFVLGVCFLLPSLVLAQSQTGFNNVSVQLWPEYDQPSMLVITDFELAENATLPVDVTFRIPLDANLIAVANYSVDGNLLQATFTEPQVNGEWQVFTMTVETGASRFEYYQPLTMNGTQRTFSFLWDNPYTVKEFSIRALKPLDTSTFEMDPVYDLTYQEDDLTYYERNPVKLAADQQFALNIQYDKSSNALLAQPQGVQPSGAVDESTPGRISLNNYLPYIIGALGLIFLGGGAFYLWQANRFESKKPRRRIRSHTESDSENGESATGSYCAQCGTRARPSDRFCRTCGARLRSVDE